MEMENLFISKLIVGIEIGSNVKFNLCDFLWIDGEKLIYRVLYIGNLKGVNEDRSKR